MYKKQSKQIGVTDFGMPLGLKLEPDSELLFELSFTLIHTSALRTLIGG